MSTSARIDPPLDPPTPQPDPVPDPIPEPDPVPDPVPDPDPFPDLVPDPDPPVPPGFAARPYAMHRVRAVGREWSRPFRRTAA